MTDVCLRVIRLPRKIEGEFVPIIGSENGQGSTVVNFKLAQYLRPKISVCVRKADDSQITTP